MCITTFPCIPLTNSFELSAFNSRCLSSVFLLRLITHNLLLFPDLPFDSALGDIHPLLHFSYDLRLITYDFLSAFNFYLKTSISIISRVYPSTSLWVTSSSVCISRTTYDLLLTTPFELSAFTSRLLSTTRISLTTYYLLLHFTPQAFISIPPNAQLYHSLFV